MPRSSGLVLCYHGVSEAWPASIAVRPKRLEEQLRLLIRRGYRGATFTEVAQAPHRKLFAVTFDDAYRSVLKQAYPVLARLNVPGTVFVPTRFAGREAPMAWPGIDQWSGGPFESELVPMSWSELRLLARADWEIGSHTRTHPRLPELDDERLADELEGSKRDCEEELQSPCRSIAYPYSDVDARVATAALAAGYDAGGVLLRGAAILRGSGVPATIAWPRVGIYADDTPARFRLKASPTLRRLRTSRLWPRSRSRRGAPLRARHA